jgi:hypothetical protein
LEGVSWQKDTDETGFSTEQVGSLFEKTPDPFWWRLLVALDPFFFSTPFSFHFH